MNHGKETIILAHGLWTNANVFLCQRRWLSGMGFVVSAVSYPSWQGGLADNVRLLSRFVAQTRAEVIHIEAHSLGGLVALALLADEPDPRLRRLVLMGTPCAGCHCASVVLATPLVNAIVGRTYRDWRSRPALELRPGVDIGVIAGTLSIGIGRLIPGLQAPNDGVVTVAETYLATARDRIVLPVCHTGMLVSRACARQAAGFLRTGGFAHD